MHILQDATQCQSMTEARCPQSTSTKHTVPGNTQGIDTAAPGFRLHGLSVLVAIASIFSIMLVGQWSTITRSALPSVTPRAAPVLQRVLSHLPGYLSKHQPYRESSVHRANSKQTARQQFTFAAVSTTAAGLATMEVHRVPCLTDNYSWLLHEKSSGLTAVVDPSESQPVIRALEARKLKLDYILNTHHHWDHVGGNEELKRKYRAQIVGPKADEARIPGIDIALADGAVWRFGDLEMHVIDTPGHTRGHVTLWFPQAEAVFTGDTLFALGCGRLFEGTPQQMWSSLSKLLPLPPTTKMYCGHEYTQSNAKFAVHVDPDNAALHKRKKQIDELRSKGEATVPSTFGEELQTNPFLRPGDAGIRSTLGISPGAPDVEAFAAIRKAKDNF